MNFKIHSWGETAASVTTCDDTFWGLVAEADLNWIYIRAGAGSLQAEGLARCEGVAKIYQNDQIEIYQIHH